MTIFLDEFTALPAPSDVELEAMDRRISWPGFDVTPHTRCGFSFWCQLRNLNHIRPYVYQWIEENCEPTPTGETRIYTVARWDSLLACYEHECEMQDARDTRQTEMGARYAGVPSYNSR